MSDADPSWTDRGLPRSLDPRRAGGRRGRRRLSRRYGSAVVMSSFTPPPRSGRGRAARGLSWVALSMSVVMLLTAVGGYALYQHLDGNLTRAQVFQAIGGDGARPTKAPAAGAALNVLLVGSDTRSGADSEFQGTGAEYVGSARSDTTIVAHISADRQRAVLVSIPRDLLVSIPRCTDPNTGESFKALSVAQFNSAFARGELDAGNPGCLIGTVEMLTGIKLDHYIEVDFTGFRQMVDALDGVPICLAKPLKDTNNTVDLPAGDLTLDGAQALGFVRARKGLANGTDLARIDRQKSFLSAMVRKASSNGMLLRPDRLISFLNATTSALTVDEALSLSDMKTIASSLGDLDPARVTFVTLPYDPDPGPAFERGGKYYGRVKLDESRAEPLFAALRNDTPIAGEQVPSGSLSPTPSASPSPTGPTLLVAPETITVDVRNGNGRAGAAGSAADALRGLNFSIGDVADADVRSTQTIVRYGRDQADSAQTLAAAVPGAVLKLDTTLGSRLQLIVGDDFPAELTPVTAGSAAPSAGTQSLTPSPTPSLDSQTADQDACV